MRFLVLVTVLAACHGNERVVEPQLAGGESPAAFERSIGLTLVRTGEPRRALPYLERLARLEPQQAAPLCYLGRAYMDLQLWQQARNSLDRALVLDPAFAPTYDLLGMLLDARGDHEGAIDAHRKAVALAPGSAGYHNNLGFSLYLDHRYVDAVSAYEQALRLDANMPRVHNNLGFALAKLGRLSEATEHFRLGGRPAEAANNLGMVYEERGELELAFDAYSTAVQAEPELAIARSNLERVTEKLGKPIARRD